MKKLLLALAMLPLACAAQTITGLTASLDVKSVPINTEIRVTVALEPVAGVEPWCGLIVDFGDGNMARSPIRDKTEMPFVTTHRYAVPGNFVIKAEGAMLRRGLRTVPPCERSRTLAVYVPDPKAAKEAERLKQEIEERDRALKQAQEERDRALREAEEAKAKAAVPVYVPPVSEPVASPPPAQTRVAPPRPAPAPKASAPATPPAKTPERTRNLKDVF